MKNLFFISVACSIFSGISLSATGQKHISAVKFNDGNSKDKSPKFIEGIEIKADNVSNTRVVTTEAEFKSTIAKKTTKPVFVPTSIEKISSLQFKYAQLLDRNVEELKNVSLYSFIDEWWETRYHYGGTGKKGIDCSAFSSLLMNTVFAIKLPRTAREQYDATEKLDKEDMTEGDLVFFNTRGGISHVGVYLGDGYFVHASRNNGVTISNLSDPYYSKHFIGGRRVANDTNDNTKTALIN